jgi:hypothetical protein
MSRASDAVSRCRVSLRGERLGLWAIGVLLFFVALSRPGWVSSRSWGGNARSAAGEGEGEKRKDEGMEKKPIGPNGK